MRSVATCCFLLLVVGWIACHIELNGATGAAGHGAGEFDDGWRRTSDGWERRHSWHADLKTAASWPPSGVHPLRLAVWQLILSLLALIAFDRELWSWHGPGESLTVSRSEP